MKGGTKILFRLRGLPLFALAATLLMVPASCAEKKQGPRAVRGVIDLRNWNPAVDGPVTLSGEWEFYWQKFLPEQEMVHEGSGVSTHYVQVPHIWTGTVYNNEILPGDGFATYRLKVLLTEKERQSQVNCPTRQQMALKISDAASAYSLYLDDKKIASNGTTAETRENAVPQEKPMIARFIPPARSFFITVHVSNFHHRNGGLWREIILGSNSCITAMHKEKLAFEFFLAGSLVIIASYYLTMFLLGRKDHGFFYFSIFTMLLAFRNLVIDEKFLTTIFPSISYEIFIKAAHLSVYLSLPFLLLFFRSLYPDEVKPWFVRFISTLTIVISTLVFLLPVRYYYWTLNIFFAGVAALICIMLYVLVMALIHRRKWALMIGAVTLLFATIVLHDILAYKSLVSSINLLPLGWLIFILSHAYILSFNYAKSFKDLEVVSGVLEKNNEELGKSLEVLKSTQDRLILNEKKAVVGSLAAGLAHEIRNQLSAISYLEFIEDRFTVDEMKFVRFIYDSRDRISSIVNEVRALAKNEESHYSVQLLTLKNVIDEAVILARMDPDVTSRDIVTEHGFTGELEINRNRIIQVLLNLIRNAAHAIANQEKGRIVIRTRQDDDYLEIQVIDNGTGMDSTTFSSIWQPFFTTKREKGTGLGLHISRRIIEGHNGSISCISELGKGTTFTIRLPLPGHHPAGQEPGEKG